MKWLIQFVYETRDYRQQQNNQISEFISGRVIENQQAGGLRGESEEDTELFKSGKEKRMTKNTRIAKSALKDPLRVYSALIEFEDVTAYKA